jgi:hypothetical protein
MQTKEERKSKILNISEYFEKFNLRNKFSKKIAKHHRESNLNNFPTEILLKFFDLLTLNDLLTCSLVCKDWYNATNEPTLWINLAKFYNCSAKIIQISEEFNVDYKNAFKRFFFSKRQIVLLKLGEKLSKKCSNYSGLPDLKSFQADISNLDWFLEFFDKRSKCILSIKSSEFNSFEGGFSTVWSNLDKLTYQLILEIEKVSLFVNVPVYLDCYNGKLSSQKSNTFHYNINTKKILIKEYDNFLKTPQVSKNNKSTSTKIHEDSLIKIRSVSSKFLVGFWNSSSKEDPIFITYSSVFDKNLVEIIYKLNTAK